MYSVKKANINDIPELLEIAVQFWNESPNYKKRPININKVKTQLQTFDVSKNDINTTLDAIRNIIS